MQVSNLWRQVSVRGAIADFREVFEQAGANRWRIAVMAAAATMATFWLIAREEIHGRPPPPKIDYITTFKPNQTEKEMIQYNIAAQLVRDKLEAEQAKRDAEVRRIYRELGRMTFIDVDAMEEKIKEEQVAEERAERERLGRLPKIAERTPADSAKR